MRAIEDLTKEELFELANLASNGYFNGLWSRDHKEVETGGYGLRRRVEWIMNLEGYDEYHCFEISAENKKASWRFSCRGGHEVDSVTKKPKFENVINICNITEIVDYCRFNDIDIKNSLNL
jgi:hypothetical protein